MKLSTNTLSILKNFSAINSGLYFKQGNVLSTVSQSKTVLAQVTVEEDFPKEFGIYDLNNFLSVLSLQKDAPELDFDDSHVIVKFMNGRSKIKYRVTDKSMLYTPPDKQIVLPSVDVQFKLTQEDYEWIVRTASVLQSPNIAVEGVDGKLRLSSFDASNDSAHVNSIDIGETENGFRYVFKTENLNKIMSDSYEVEISAKGISHFKNGSGTSEYWVSTEKV
jgi:hypothetical protein